MQLLDSEQLEFAFQAHGITLESVARTFYADVWAVIQAGEKAKTQGDLTDLSATLRKLCNDYFARVREWREEESESCEGGVVCAASQQNSQSARLNLPLFEKQFFRYALCYLELNRALIRNRSTLSYFARAYDIDENHAHLEVNSATGEVLERIHHDRHILLEKRLRLERVETLLRHLDEPFSYLDVFLPDVFGADEGRHQMVLFKAALRQKNFSGAGEICRAWKDQRVKMPAETILTLVRQHAEELGAQGGLMLQSSELALIKDFLRQDEARLNGFLDKYNVPYMVFQYRNLIRQGYLLGHIGSLESLIIAHAKLSALAARPHGDEHEARAQEAAILVPMRVLMTQKFPTLGAIFTEIETTCAILEKLFSQTRDYLRHAPSV